ncbi:hypothetical protein B0H14DRAFT_3870178 [Mycena olivaceomarginata]|nr:hypothetical protein B0H14DRAFT_3870178 [Mycena olivaceomarginata]
MFTRVTHLDLRDTIPYLEDDARFYSFLPSLPALTHLSGWRLLVYTQHIMVSKEKLISVDDLRLVYMQENSRHLEEWLTGTRGEMDFWACADAFVVKKRCDEIEPLLVAINLRHFGLISLGFQRARPPYYSISLSLDLSRDLLGIPDLNFLKASIVRPGVIDPAALPCTLDNGNNGGETTLVFDTSPASDEHAYVPGDRASER